MISYLDDNAADFEPKTILASNESIGALEYSQLLRLPFGMAAVNWCLEHVSHIMAMAPYS